MEDLNRWFLYRFIGQFIKGPIHLYILKNWGFIQYERPSVNEADHYCQPAQLWDGSF